MLKAAILFLLFTPLIVAIVVFLYQTNEGREAANLSSNQLVSSLPSPSLEPIPSNIPQQKIMEEGNHTFQTFNNCGPAALSMSLSYFDINTTQQALGQDLRPYQNPLGDNDDKSVTLEEMGEKAKTYGLIPYHRPNGNTELLKKFIANDIPIIARTWTKPDEDIGHYRIVKGYDEIQGVLIQDDSLQGKNLRYSYQDFNVLWKKFNYEYLVLVPVKKNDIAKSILGKNINKTFAWQKAAEISQEELDTNPSDTYSRFNLSVALYHIGQYQNSANEFEKVENSLPFRTLWYQIEPIQAYYKLGDYEKVFSITDQVLNNHNRAFSELYLIRGEIHKNRNNLIAAREEFEKAVFYNSNLEKAKLALESI
jgi:hypothetical protein